MIEVQYEYTADDFADGQIAAAEVIPRLKRLHRVTILIGVLLLVAPFGILATGGRLSYRDPRLWIDVGLGMYLLVAGTILRRPLLKRRYRSTPHLAGSYVARFGEPGLEIEGPQGSAQLQWSSFDRFLESATNVTLVRLPGIMNSFPKRAFTPEQLAEFRELLARKIPLKK